MKILNFLFKPTLLLLPLLPFLTLATPINTIDFTPLHTLLSPASLLLLPSSPSFHPTLARWSSNPSINAPTPAAIIIPATEADLSATIRFCSHHDIPFLATAGGHGVNSHLAELGGRGVVISLPNLTRLEVGEVDYREGTAVVVLGGGLLSGEVVRGLWAEGYETTTGVCACVGLVGPVLGGGHGLLQGRYGLGADQIVSARVVLGNGEVVEVGSREWRTRDLFWGMRGAGHNFGVVSELRYRVYRVREERRAWAWEKFTFRGERLEEVYALSNRMMERQPPGMVHWSLWKTDATVDADKPVIVYSVLYNGPMAESRAYSSPLHALGPVAYSSGVTEYPGLPSVMGTDYGQPDCQPKGTAVLRAADVDRYEVVALRNWYNIFNEMLATAPDLADSSCMLEGYSVQGVQAVPAESTAFPHRGQRLLLAPVILYETIGNTTLDREAEGWGEAMETAAFGSFPRRTYVNYASGNEKLQALYGYEPWRLEKLRAVKKKYDPQNRFRFYAPIV